MKRLIFLGMLSLAIAGNYANAVVETIPRTITTLGIRPGDNQAYFRLSGPFATTCYANFVFIALSDPGGKQAYAQALSAFIAGKKITWLDYKLVGGSACFLTQLDME